jgi:hypothetical protein
MQKWLTCWMDALHLSPDGLGQCCPSPWGNPLASQIRICLFVVKNRSRRGRHQQAEFFVIPSKFKRRAYRPKSSSAARARPAATQCRAIS